MVQTIRNLVLLLTLGMFLGAATANACDGSKACCNGKTKGTKTAMKSCTDKKCMKNGKCTMSKAEMKSSGCCSAKSATASAEKSAKNCPAGAGHSCCKGKTGADKS